MDHPSTTMPASLQPGWRYDWTTQRLPMLDALASLAHADTMEVLTQLLACDDDQLLGPTLIGVLDGMVARTRRTS